MQEPRLTHDEIPQVCITAQISFSLLVAVEDIIRTIITIANRNVTNEQLVGGPNPTVGSSSEGRWVCHAVQYTGGRMRDKGLVQCIGFS